MAIKKLPAHEAILCLLETDSTEFRYSDEERLGFRAGLLGVLGRMVIPGGEKEYVINKLRSLGQQDSELQSVVEPTIEQINAG